MRYVGRKGKEGKKGGREEIWAILFIRWSGRGVKYRRDRTRGGSGGGILRYSINSNFHRLRVHKAIEVEISIERS